MFLGFEAPMPIHRILARVAQAAQHDITSWTEEFSSRFMTCWCWKQLLSLSRGFGGPHSFQKFLHDGTWTDVICQSRPTNERLTSYSGWGTSLFAAYPLVFNVFALLRPRKIKILQKFRASREKPQIPWKRRVCRAHGKLQGQIYTPFCTKERQSYWKRSV